MNKRINFEDTIFILNVRIRMIRDFLHLDINEDIFYQQTMNDIEFINTAMDMLTEKFLANLKFLDRDTEADNILDAEWQLGQLINEIANSAGYFSNNRYQDAYVLIDKLRKDNSRRKKQIEESSALSGQSTAEPVVTYAELNGLLGSA